MRAVAHACLVGMIAALVLGGQSGHVSAAAVTYSPLPVKGVSSATGQIAPASRSISVALDPTSSTWTPVRQQFEIGNYALRLAWGGPRIHQ